MPICEHREVYHFVSRTKTRYKIATSMYDPQIIYDSQKDTTIYRRLLIGRDGHLDQSEAYDIS